MSSTDSDSSNHKRHKSNKKSKRKSEKKHKKQKKEKRQKQRKRSKHESSSSGSESSTEVKIPKIIAAPRDVVLDTDSFGPALPPHLLKRQSEEQLEPVIIGPIIPSHLTSPSVSRKEVSPNINDNTRIEASNDENEDDGTYGPLPVTEGNAPMTAAQIELEQRALELKLAAIEGTSSQPVDQKVREEWMLELPDVGLKGGLAALSNMKRTFHHGKEKPDFSDRSVWTKTPQGENQPQKPSTSKQDVEALRNDAQAIYERQRDEEQERMAKKHKKKHKRDESLVEIHQKKLRKEQKKREKELAASGEKPERRPFSRDVDLKLNKIDKNQTKSIVDKAKILNTKFASGHTKYL